MKTIGYARVSTDGQTLDAQADQLKAAGVDFIFQEKVSGSRTDRKALADALNNLHRGDVLVVTRLDRLARSTRDLLNILAVVAERGAAFRSLTDLWADTSTAHGRLMLTVLGGLAEFERELIRARTSDGRNRAIARGTRMGRRRKLSAFQIKEAHRRHEAGESASDIARTFAVHRSTISRLLAEKLPDFEELPRPSLSRKLKEKLAEKASGRH